VGWIVQCWFTLAQLDAILRPSPGAKLARDRFAKASIAPATDVLSKLEFVSQAPLRSELLRSAQIRSASLRFAFISCALFSLAAYSEALFKLAPIRMALFSSADCHYSKLGIAETPRDFCVAAITSWA
jgi:hypothetical protein